MTQALLFFFHQLTQACLFCNGQTSAFFAFLSNNDWEDALNIIADCVLMIVLVKVSISMFVKIYWITFNYFSLIKASLNFGLIFREHIVYPFPKVDLNTL